MREILKIILFLFTYFARRLNPKKKAKIDVKGNPENVGIKDIDWKLINQLKENSKKQVIKLAKELNLTATSVIKKIKELKQK